MASSGSRSGREDMGSRGVDMTKDLERTLSQVLAVVPGARHVFTTWLDWLPTSPNNTVMM